MSSKVDIANLGLAILGKPPISSFDENTKSARVISIAYDPHRRSLLEGRAIWRFSVTRAQLAASAVAPLTGPYQTQYPMPPDCLRPLTVGDFYPGLDLSDYRLGETDAGYSFEGRMVLCDYGSPLSFTYIRDIVDATFFNSWFVRYLAADIAWTVCEELTGSDSKQQLADTRRKDAMLQAVQTQALYLPSTQPADDTWVACRMF